MSTGARGLGREELRAWRDSDPRQVEAVGVPAGADRRIGRHGSIRVLGAGVGEHVELRSGDPEEPLCVQLARERCRPPSVLRVVAVVQPHRVVQEREEEDDVGVHTVDRAGEPEAVRPDRAPVQLAVDVRADAGAPRAHGRQERVERERSHGHVVIFAQRRLLGLAIRPPFSLLVKAQSWSSSPSSSRPEPTSRRPRRRTSSPRPAEACRARVAATIDSTKPASLSASAGWSDATDALRRRLRATNPKDVLYEEYELKVTVRLINRILAIAREHGYEPAPVLKAAVARVIESSKRPLVAHPPIAPETFGRGYGPAALSTERCSAAVGALDVYVQCPYSVDMAKVARATDRWDFRVAADADEFVRRAADVSQRTLTDFVVEAAVVEADRVLGDRTRFALEDEEWTRFMDMLDRPPQENPGLAKLFSKSSVFE